MALSISVLKGLIRTGLLDASLVDPLNPGLDPVCEAIAEAVATHVSVNLEVSIPIGAVIVAATGGVPNAAPIPLTVSPVLP